MLPISVNLTSRIVGGGVTVHVRVSNPAPTYVQTTDDVFPAPLAANASQSFAPPAPLVSVTITATVPKDTPADATIYLAGNLDQVGKK